MFVEGTGAGTATLSTASAVIMTDVAGEVLDDPSGAEECGGEAIVGEVISWGAMSFAATSAFANTASLVKKW